MPTASTERDTLSLHVKHCDTTPLPRPAQKLQPQLPALPPLLHGQEHARENPQVGTGLIFFFSSSFLKRDYLQSFTTAMYSKLHFPFLQEQPWPDLAIQPAGLQPPALQPQHHQLLSLHRIQGSVAGYYNDFIPYFLVFFMIIFNLFYVNWPPGWSWMRSRDNSITCNVPI